MTHASTPTFAIIGHPNEGKSSVVSPLTENDRVNISSTPGETIRNERISLKVDNESIIQFIDTPGFQNPLRVLDWFEENHLGGVEAIAAFQRHFASDPDFDHDCELLKPIAEGAGILFVVDGARPITGADLAEMEILRLIGNPRMAIINTKSDRQQFIDDWKSAFRKSFNAIRVFDACKADYRNRIDLLDALKSIEQDWSPQLQEAIELLQVDRDRRRSRSVEIIQELLERSIVFKKTKLFSTESDAQSVKSKLEESYREELKAIEGQAWKSLLQQFNHTRLDMDVPDHSLPTEDLFSEQTWQALGLTRKQLAIAAAGLGAGIGAGLDLAFGGITFGVFTASAAAAGAGAAFLKGRDLARLKIKRIPIGGYQVTVGPSQNEQFPYVLLDRVLLLYQFISNRSHARQDTKATLSNDSLKSGVCSGWDNEKRSLCAKVFKAIKSRKRDALDRLRKPFPEMLVASLLELENKE